MAVDGPRRDEPSLAQYLGLTLPAAVALGEHEDRLVVVGDTGSFGINRNDLLNRVKVTLDAAGRVTQAIAG